QDLHMPSIGIYYGESIRNAGRASAKRFSWPEEWYNRAQMRRFEDDGDVDYPCHRPLALALIEGLIEREFDVAAIAGLAGDQHEGHAYSFVHRWYLKDSGARMLPVVPIFLNTYNPPNPPLPRRCVRLGKSLKELIETYPEELRVGLVASGGLSHFVVEEDLDRAIIEALRRKDLDFLAGLDPRRLKAGSSEIRNWVGAAALHELQNRCIRDVIRFQESVGLHAITDGEYRRSSFHADFIEKLGGARAAGRLAIEDTVSGVDEERTVTGKPFAPRAFTIVGKLRHGQPIEVENFMFVKANTKRTAKQAIPSPTMLLRG